MSQKLSKRQNATVGAAAGIVDITCIQWAYYMKNARQQGMPLTLNPRVLYRGYSANCGNIAVGTGFQFFINGYVEKLMTGGIQRKLSSSEQISSGFLAGFTSGVVASPAELVMTQQQVKGGSLGSNIVNILQQGPNNVFRGLTTTCMREGIFAAAYLGIAPSLRSELSHRAPNMNSEVLRVASAVAGAAVCGALSHPFDTIKTCMQGDVERKTFGNVRQTASTIWSSGSAGAFYRGIEFRFLRQVWQVWVLDLLREKLSPALYPAEFGLTASTHSSLGLYIPQALWSQGQSLDRQAS
mmetsp:Transcript_97906/g.169568  ORF Transcript_97906/g.169568 Transcript_97906/m.169568 type:complete len:297 (+) Transcript_97906:29-919(+)